MRMSCKSTERLCGPTSLGSKVDELCISDLVFLKRYFGDIRLTDKGAILSSGEDFTRFSEDVLSSLS